MQLELQAQLVPFGLSCQAETGLQVAPVRHLSGSYREGWGCRTAIILPARMPLGAGDPICPIGHAGQNRD